MNILDYVLTLCTIYLPITGTIYLSTSMLPVLCIPFLVLSTCLCMPAHVLSIYPLLVLSIYHFWCYLLVYTVTGAIYLPFLVLSTCIHHYWCYLLEYTITDAIYLPLLVLSTYIYHYWYYLPAHN